MGSFSDRLHSAPFVRLLIPFICGIFLAEWLLPHKSCLYFSFPLLLTLLLFFFSGSSLKYDTLRGLLVLVIFFSLGFSIALNYRYIPKNLVDDKYYAVLDEYPVEKGKSYRAIIRLMDPKIKVLAYFEQSHELSSVQPGTILFFQGCPELIKNQGNPFEFDYEGYSNRNRIGHRIYLKSNAYHFIQNAKILNLQNKALILREKLLKRLADSGVRGETFHVISAITLGARDNLDPETTESFTRTGTLHVLAVSGGNVAVIYILLNFLFYFLKKYRVGLILHTFIIIFGIWGYALITGLSPSVLRAAAMFTFIVIGNNFSREPNIYNSLATSAFILLCLNPSLLFDAGFQLSYAAVIAIVFLHPVIYKSIYCRYWILDRGWLILSVSLAAQIGTLPFSLYYFHQFPSYFWLSNTVVVPLVSVLLYMTFAVIAIVPYLPLLGVLIAHFLNWIGEQMLEFLQIVERLPFAVIENLYPFAYQIILITLCITLTAIFIKNRSAVMAFLTLGVIALVLLVSSLSFYKSISRKEVVVFNISGKTLLTFTDGQETTWLTNERPAKIDELNYFTQPYIGFRRIKKQNHVFLSDTSRRYTTNLVMIKNFINFQGVKIYVLNNKLTNLNLFEGFPKPDVVLLTEKQNTIPVDLQLKYPEMIFINARSPITFNKKELVFDNTLKGDRLKKSEDSGAIKITIQKFPNNNTLFKTTYFNE